MWGLRSFCALLELVGADCSQSVDFKPYLRLAAIEAKRLGKGIGPPPWTLVAAQLAGCIVGVAVVFVEANVDGICAER